MFQILLVGEQSSLFFYMLVIVDILQGYIRLICLFFSWIYLHCPVIFVCFYSIQCLLDGFPLLLIWIHLRRKGNVFSLIFFFSFKVSMDGQQENSIKSLNLVFGLMLSLIILVDHWFGIPFHRFFFSSRKFSSMSVRLDGIFYFISWMDHICCIEFIGITMEISIIFNQWFYCQEFNEKWFLSFLILIKMKSKTLLLLSLSWRISKSLWFSLCCSWFTLFTIDDLYSSKSPLSAIHSTIFQYFLIRLFHWSSFIILQRSSSLIIYIEEKKQQLIFLFSFAYEDIRHSIIYWKKFTCFIRLNHIHHQKIFKYELSKGLHLLCFVLFFIRFQ